MLDFEAKNDILIYITITIQKNYEKMKQIERFRIENEQLIQSYEEMMMSLCDDELNACSQQIISSGVTSTPWVALQTCMTCAVETGSTLDDVTRKYVDDMRTSNASSRANKTNDECDASSRERGEYNVLQRYFKEVNDAYVVNPIDESIEFCEANRDKIITMNLRTVIYIAKRYQQSGVALEDLIAAGNLGLCEAFAKYSPRKSQVKRALCAMFDVDKSYASHDIITTFESNGLYGNVLQNAREHFTNAFYVGQHVIAWLDANIHVARFNSVASFWIRAKIIEEIKQSRQLIKNMANDPSLSVVSIDEQLKSSSSSTSNDKVTTIADRIDGGERCDSTIDDDDTFNAMKMQLNKLMTGVALRDKRIVLQKFGVGIQRPLLPKEISMRENLSIARISQITQNVMQQMRDNAIKYNVDINALFEMIRTLNENDDE